MSYKPTHKTFFFFPRANSNAICLIMLLVKPQLQNNYSFMNYKGQKDNENH